MGKLQDWVDQDWVRIDSSGNIAGPCGTSKNKKRPDRCLPRSKAQSLSKSERKSTAQKKKREGAKGKKVVSNTKAATVRMARGGEVADPKPKRPIVGPKKNGKAVARGCGIILADREKYTKGSVTQS
jgi:hypothetical protein